MPYLLILSVCLVCALPAHAGVRAVADSNSEPANELNLPDWFGDVPQENIEDIEDTDVDQYCYNMGFELTACPNGYVAVYPCPFDNTYFKDCCPQEYKYSRSYCFQQGLEPSTDSCFGAYACHEPIKQDSY